MGNPYNGFSAAERAKKLVDMHRQISSGLLRVPRGPCRLCNDPGEAKDENQFEYHDEDYSWEYKWAEPYAFVVCKLCHLRIHTRFKHPEAWHCFLAHVRRGGYAREMREVSVKRELGEWRRALNTREQLPLLRPVRQYVGSPGNEWFSRLSVQAVFDRTNQTQDSR